MKPIWIFRHDPSDGPGYLAEFLIRHDVPHEVIRVDAGDAVPASPEGAAGLALMGGSMSANDALPWIEAELALIRRAADRGIPLLGHCLGAQLITRGLGGDVTRNPVKEIGWFPVHRVDGGEEDRWLAGLPAKFDVFHWHWETFSLPERAVPLLRSEHCDRQGYALGNNLALQCHIEMTEDMVREWAAAHAEDLPRGVPSVQSANTMLQDLERRVAALHQVADILYGKWVCGLAR